MMESMVHGHWEHLSTSAIPPPMRVQRWNEYGSETLSNMTVDPQADSDFSASIARISLGQMGMISLGSTAASARSDGGAAGCWAADERDALMLVMPVRGSSIFEQDRRVVELAPGDMALRDLSRPWIHRCSGPMELIMVKLPFSLLAGRVRDVQRLIDTGFCATDPAVAMTMSVVRSARHTLSVEPDGCWRDEMSDLVFHSLLLLTAERGERDEVQFEASNRASLRREAVSFILNNLEDPELAVADVASALGVRMRTLQRAFFETGQTPRQFIQTQRLDRAARELSRRSNSAPRSILDVAFSVGFSDVSHFSRSFSRRYGVPPRNYRGNLPVALSDQDPRSKRS